AARSDASQVRRRREFGLVQNSLDRRVRALTGRAACAVGDRDEARMKWLEGLDRLPQALLHLLALGREEFEADRDVAARFGEQRLVRREAFERVHAARLCGMAAFTPRQRVTVSSPPSRCSIWSTCSP